MKILAIDQSLTCSGIAYTGENGELVVSNLTPKKVRGSERLDFIYEYFKELVVKVNPDIVVLESYAYGISAGAGMTFSLGELGGVLKLLFFKLRLPLIVVSIGTHKKFVTGSGSTKKDAMMMFVLKRYNIETTNDNESDAISLFKTVEALHKYMKQGPEGFTKKEVEALNALETNCKEEYPLTFDKLKQLS